MSGIGAEFGRKRDAVLECFESYEKLHSKEDGIDLDYLAQRCNSIKGRKFQIAVVGEVKAGKSTLINALLRETLLPSDVLQASSAIIQIVKSDNRQLKVEYADGRITHEAAENAVDVNWALRRVGALEDKYRDIPTNLLDEHLRKTQAQVRKISREDILAIGRQAGQNLDDKVAQVLEYLDKRQLTDIPVRIQVEYPLPFAFSGLSIIDSPGVNAIGGVQDTTFQYLSQADAILFVHSLMLPIEQNSLRDFVNKVVSKRSRETLFLLLSHAGAVGKFECSEKLSEAHRLYRDAIDIDRILTVDSLMPRIAQDIQGNADKTLQDVLQRYKTQEEMGRTFFQKTGESFWRNDSIEAGKRRMLLRELQDEFEDLGFPDGFTDKLQERAGFVKMEQAVDHLASSLPLITLQDIMGKIGTGLASQRENIISDLELSEKSYQDPQGFANRIEGEKAALLELEASTYMILDNLEKSFSGYAEELESTKKQLHVDLDAISGKDSFRKFHQDFANNCDQLVRNAAIRFKEETESKLVTLSVKTTSGANFRLPKMDFDVALSKASRNATREETVETETSKEARHGNMVDGGLVGGGALLLLGFFTGGLAWAIAGALTGAAAGVAIVDANSDKLYDKLDVVDETKLSASLRNEILNHINPLLAGSISGDGSSVIEMPVSLLDILHNIRIEFRKEIVEEMGARCAARVKTLDELAAMKDDNKRIGKRIAAQREQIMRVESLQERVRTVKENV